MRNLIYSGRVKDGKLIINRRDDLQKDIAAIPDNTEVFITITDRSKLRTAKQNRYMWGYLYPLIRDGMYDIGYDNFTINDTHDFLAFMFLQVEKVNPNTGEILKSVKSTANLSTEEISKYFENIARWAAEFLGIVVKNQPNWEKWYDKK